MARADIQLPLPDSLRLSLQRFAVISVLGDKLAHVWDTEAEFAGEVTDLVLFVSSDLIAILLSVLLLSSGMMRLCFSESATSRLRFCCSRTSISKGEALAEDQMLGHR
ncbi:hypothetical protein [Mesorhizobium neociceri]